ncbi:hypothetical protein QEJ31_02045 [Pigmentibacter sp. JX0631]|uniref:hypothetical protein n=1 Tax=Pigmentibacter sp. JX0631 TaxID=2976982 RepID=UPI0024693638|nr:hypothetical protein [Pigmentibacter sp. JX0631]WGL60385.1 hypothetical protein QEJ31_02045 [Pigmentibacter sp. JX0631]
MNLRLLSLNIIILSTSLISSACRYTPTQQMPQNYSADRFPYSPEKDTQRNLLVNQIYQINSGLQEPIPNFTIEGNVFCTGKSTYNRQFISNLNDHTFKISPNSTCSVTIEKLHINNSEFIPQIYAPIKKYKISILETGEYILPDESVIYQNAIKFFWLSAKVLPNNLLEFYLSDTSNSVLTTK